MMKLGDQETEEEKENAEQKEGKRKERKRNTIQMRRRGRRITGRGERGEK